MSGKFFYELNDSRYPPILKSCLQVWLKYNADLLYDSISVDQRYKRMILANIQGNVSRYNVDKFKSTNPVYPFTAYNIQEQEIDEVRKNHFGKSGHRVLDIAGVRVVVIPYKVEVQMVSFFTSSHDYLRARTLLQNDAASLTRFYFPVIINGVRYRSSFNVDMQGPSKGEYAFEFDQYLRENNIYDIVHTSFLEYNELIVESQNMYPVESKILDTVLLMDEVSLDVNGGDAPYIVSISVEDDDIDVIRQPVQIAFSEPMSDDLSLVHQSIIFTPESNIEYTWNNDKTILSVQPENGFMANTMYIMEVFPFLVSQKYVRMKNGIVINFRTGA